MSATKLKVLCVDDEPRVVSGMERCLRDRYDVSTATGGAEGLAALERHRDIAIVISDMRMPQMDGAVFLQHVRARSANTVRVLLTGYADLHTCTAAINKGQVYRLLVKPCLPDELAEALLDAEHHHQQLTDQKRVMQKTAVGAVKTLIETMGWSNPVAMSRAVRLRHRVARMAQLLQIERHWALEMAALLSELGMLSLPPGLSLKLDAGQGLTPSDQEQIYAARRSANRLMMQMPCLQPIAQLLERAFVTELDFRPDTSLPAGEELQVGVLRLAAELSRVELIGAVANALNLARRRGNYPTELLDAAHETFLNAPGTEQSGRMSDEQLQLGITSEALLARSARVAALPAVKVLYRNQRVIAAVH